jgi:formamidopyrimidine-DNA glycosylase
LLPFLVPELPEVESIRRTLAPPLIGRHIVRARLLRRDFCTRGDGRPCSPRDLLQGTTIRALDRRGKQLAIIATDGCTLVVQLGMSGQFLLTPRGMPPPNSPHVHCLWTLDDGATLLSRDPRRFGGLWALPCEDALRQRWSALGPDALTIAAPELTERAGKSARAIKAALLDQRVLAGVGNIYADEALFRAGIHPLRTARSLSGNDWPALASAIRDTLSSAIEAGGSTLRDYRNALGVAGSAQLTHAVYARAGQSCIRCGRPLRGIRIAQRATVYCPRCQPRRQRRIS